MQGLFGQGDQPVFVAFGVADMNPHIEGVDISDGQTDSLTEAKPKAVGSKEKDPVAQPVGKGDQSSQLLDRQDVGNPECPGWLDQGNVLPGSVEHQSVKKLQAIQIELDRTQGMTFQEFVEIIKQLIGCQVVDPAVGIVAYSPDCP